jgi:hypothetical protein
MRYLILSLLLVSGCVSTSVIDENEAWIYSADYEVVFDALVAVLGDMGYPVPTVNRDSGYISTGRPQTGTGGRHNAIIEAKLWRRDGGTGVTLSASGSLDNPTLLLQEEADAVCEEIYRALADRLR